jgi:hypothetical protein
VQAAARLQVLGADQGRSVTYRTIYKRMLTYTLSLHGLYSWRGKQCATEGPDQTSFEWGGGDPPSTCEHASTERCHDQYHFTFALAALPCTELAACL